MKNQYLKIVTYNKTTESYEGNKQAKFYPANNMMMVTTTNTKPTTNTNRPKSYHTRAANDPKASIDFDIYWKRLSTLFYKYFPMDSSNVFFVTAELKDKRYKKVDRLRKIVEKEYCNKFEGAYCVGLVELNKDHHPHCHFLITSQKKLNPQSLEKNWTLGFCKVIPITKYNNQSWTRLVNYLIKKYEPNDKMDFDKDWATYLNNQLLQGKRCLNYLRIRIEFANKKERANLKRVYANILSDQKIINRYYKKECQKQLVRKDYPIIKSRGLNTELNKVTNKEIINSLTLNSELLNSILTKNICVDVSSGEIDYEMFYKLDMYKLNKSLIKTSLVNKD